MRVGVGEEPDVTLDIVRRPRTPGGTLTVDVHGVREYRATLHAPAYQAPNAAVAIIAAAAALFNVCDPGAVDAALRAMTFPGRFELVRREPPLVLDGAHNPDAAAVLASAIRDSFRNRLPIIVLGVLADKDAEGIVGALSGAASGFITTENGSPRCLPADRLAGVVRKVSGQAALAVPDLRDALAAARERGGATGTVVTGSLYTVGAVKALGSDLPWF